MTIAPEKKMSIKDVKEVVNDYGLFAPTTKWDETPIITEEEEGLLFLERQQINNIQKAQTPLAPSEDDLEINVPIQDTHKLMMTSKLDHPDLWSANKKDMQKYEEADITTEIIK